MTDDPNVMSVNVEDAKAVAWLVGRLMSRGLWFEYRPHQLVSGSPVETTPHTLVMQTRVARDLVAEFQKAKDDGEL